MGVPTMAMFAVFLCTAVFLSLGEAVAADQDQDRDRGQGQETCHGRNEVFTQCGSACPRTCSNRGLSGDRNCVQVCVPGCFCRRGYIRDRLWQCVRLSQCRSNSRIGVVPGANTDVTTNRVPEADAVGGAQPEVKNLER